MRSLSETTHSGREGAQVSSFPIIFLKREILSEATFNFFRPPTLRVHLTLSRLKFRFLSHLSSPFGSVLSRPDKFIDAGLKLVIGFASRNGEDLFLEFVPLENHLLSSFPIQSGVFERLNSSSTSRGSLPFIRLTIAMY